ncbi:pentatricopeptide repeat-containing protein At1g05600 [Musa acuminata AAA Group]|uniref:pentatricopeptide repeat-containing protein At1g05600 n=1 Tax=Musa acuminata AAA Group TaxID=214697 RepID=UPI0031DD0FC8
MAMAVRWPRVLTPSYLAQLMRRQKDPAAALRLFDEAPLRYPSYRHNSLVYSAALDSLLSVDPLPVPALADLLSRLALRDSCPAPDLLFARAIRALSGDPPAALSLFLRLLPCSNSPSWSLSFHALLRLLLARGHLSLALRLFSSCAGRREVRLGPPALNLLVDALCCDGRPDAAVQAFAAFSDLCCYPDRDTYRNLMRGLCDAGRLDDAIHLLRSMLWRISQKGCDADVVVYRTLLEALCQNGRTAEAEEILARVLKKGLRSSKRRRTFCGPVLQGLTVEEAKKVIDEALVVRGVKSLASYRAMLKDLYAEGNFDDAQQMFDEMIESGFRPPVSIFENKISALCQEGRADDSVRVLEKEMPGKDCVPTVRTYNLVMEGLCKEGKSMRAVECLDKMDKQVGCVAQKETFEILVDGLHAECRHLEAAQVLERMLRRRYRPNRAVFSSVIQGLCSIVRRYEATLWLEEMISHGEIPEAEVWASLASMVCFTDLTESLLLEVLEHKHDAG